MFRQLISGEILSLNSQDQDQTIFPYFGSIVIIFKNLLQRQLTYVYLRHKTIFVKIKNQEAIFSKNNPSSLFAYFHKVTREFIVNLKLIQQYKEDKLRFITKFQFSPNEEDETYIDILQNPISIQNNISVFLITINWAYASLKIANQSHKVHITTNSTKINQKIKNQSYFKSQQNITPKSQKEDCKIQMALFIYAISDTIFIQKKYSDVIINLIAEYGQISYKQNNRVVVFSKVTFDKNSQYRVSTAADTKGYDLRRASFQSQINSNQSSEFRLSKLISPKNSSQSKFPLSSLVTPQNITSKERQDNKLIKFFRKVQTLECEYNLEVQKIINIIEGENYYNNNRGFILYDTIEKWFCKQSTINWELEQFYNMNQQNIFTCKIQKLLSQYRLLLEMQFKNVTTKSIEQIKNCMSRLNNQIIESFFRDTECFMNQSCQSKYYQKLLNQINREQSNLLKGLGYIKQEFVNRKVSVIQDPNYMTKTNRSSFLFQNLVGDDEINSLQVGYQVYKQTLTQKMTQIFDQLYQQKPKYYKQKLQINSQKDFISNLQRRINIYQQKKKILEQTLFLDKKQEENLQEYLKGVQRKQGNIDQIISQKQQSEIQ